MQRFLDFIGNPFYIKPVNFNFNHLDHLSLTIFIRKKKKFFQVAFYISDPMNAIHLIQLLLLSGHIETNHGPIKGDCGVR